MNETAERLPEGFGELVPHLAWGDLQTQGERYLKRQTSRFEDLEAFHGAMAPRLDDVFAWLDRFAYGPLPDAEARLLRMALGLVEAAQAVEVFGQPAVPFATVPHSVEMATVAGARA